MLRISTILLGIFLSSAVYGIINGKDADLKNNPFANHLVALQMSEVKPDGSVKYYKGSAAIIKPNVLITAGHNVAYVPDPHKVEAIFSSTPCWGSNTCGENRITAAKTTVHPLFKQITGGTEFDLALVELSQDIPPPYSPVPLLEHPVSNSSTFSVLGYGTDRESLNFPLLEFRLRSISLFPVSSLTVGSSQKFWLDQTSGGICSGDSGGPAIIEDQGNYKIGGIAIHVTYSDGVSHCLTKGAFTDILFFKDWIKENL